MKTKKKEKEKIKKKEKEKKRRKNQSGKKNQVMGKKNQAVGERKRESEKGKEKILLVFRRSELNSLRTKVGSHNESYAWVPKSEFFIEAPRGMSFLLHWFLFT